MPEITALEKAEIVVVDEITAGKAEIAAGEKAEIAAGEKAEIAAGAVFESEN